MMNVLRSLVIGFAFSFVLPLSPSASAQKIERPLYCPPRKEPKTVNLSPLTDYVPRYKAQLRLIKRRVDEHPIPTERPALLDSLMKELGEEFRATRRVDYETSQTKFLAKNSCAVGGGFLGTRFKDCGWVFAYSPDRVNMHTKPEWLCYTGTQKGIEITENGRVAALKMTRSSRGVNRGGIHVAFKFTPEAVIELAKRDWTTLLAWIS
ncbi:MAG: hypothetical protein AABN95_24800 [Acidobacteriota bacterium]